MYIVFISTLRIILGFSQKWIVGYILRYMTKNQCTSNIKHIFHFFNCEIYSGRHTHKWTKHFEANEVKSLEKFPLFDLQNMIKIIYQTWIASSLTAVWTAHSKSQLDFCSLANCTNLTKTVVGLTVSKTMRQHTLCFDKTWTSLE